MRSSTGQTGILGFTGQQTDPTGLSYLRTRYYNPTTGGFLSPDSVQPNAPGTQGYDLYSYVANDPTTMSDPSGQFAAEYGLNTGTAVRSSPAFTIFGYTLKEILLRAVLFIALAVGTAAAAETLDQVARAVYDQIMKETRVEPQPKPKPTPMCCPVPPLRQDPCDKLREAPDWPTIQSDATDVNRAWSGPYFNQTVAVLEVCHMNTGTPSFHVGSQPDLTAAQFGVAGNLGLTGETLKGAHAEPTVIEGTKSSASLFDRLEPIALYATNKFCGPDKGDCQGYLVRQGATIVDPRHAVWQPPAPVWPI